MGLFSRFVKAVSGAVDTVARTVNRLVGAEQPKAAPKAAGPLPTAIDEDRPKRAPSGPSKKEREQAAKEAAAKEAAELKTILDEDDAREKRRELADELGPVDVDEEDADRDVEEIELEQWLAYLDDNADRLPPGFVDDVRELAGEYDLDADFFTTTEMDAPKGDTPT